MEQQNILTPEQAWSKITNLKDAIDEADNKEYLENLKSGSLSTPLSDELMVFLKHIAEEQNANEIYLFCTKKDGNSKAHYLDEDDLQTIASVTINKPYAEEVLTAVMNHPKFRGLDEERQSTLLSKPSLLVVYWQNGNDFCDEAELAIFPLSNWKELLLKYFSYGHGLCVKAQKMIFAQPKEQILKLLAVFISGITEKNHAERTLCTNGLFFLLKNRPLFDLYVEKMSPFYKEKKYIFPQTIAFVARRKGWL